MRPTLRIFLVPCLFLTITGVSRAQTSELAGKSGPAPSCLVVDTDVGLDDFRAVAVLLPQRAPQAVVVTEGIAAVPRGSTAMALFLASAPSSAPVIPGLSAAHPPDYDWLPEVREGAERLN